MGRRGHRALRAPRRRVRRGSTPGRPGSPAPRAAVARWAWASRARGWTGRSQDRRCRAAWQGRVRPRRGSVRVSHAPGERRARGSGGAGGRTGEGGDSTVEASRKWAAGPIGEEGVVAHTHAAPSPRGRYLASLSLAALGVVYGDIGTSPLYAIRESFLASHGVPPTHENVLGVLSLIFWALILIISVKYLVFIMRADNRGEGGILALTALVTPVGAMGGGRWALVLLGLFGTSLLYGDGMITPAVSVLSAVEGLEVATPFFQPYVIPVTVAILVGLFLFQNHGAGRVGRVFGPVMIVWFLTIAALGVVQIAREPSVLAAVNPAHAARFFANNRSHAFLSMGSVFLAVTGGEALYADMGHFGPRPIRVAWFGFVLPALLLNYFGQGALLVREPAAVANPFYHLAPAWGLIPVVGIATVATVIASQALISGAFSLTMQAVQLGYSPRVQIDHTSASEKGQIYIPAINWTLMLACIGLVLGFRTSSHLAAAYGLAVTTTMVVTTLLFYVVAREQWRWNIVLAVMLVGFFLAIDVSFWGANLLKIPHGGWFPILIGAIVFTLLTTWKRGRELLRERIRAQTLPLEQFLREIEARPPMRVPGTAVYMYSDPGGTPPALLHNLKHNKVLHERVAFLSVRTEEVPYVGRDDRVEVRPLAEGVFQVVLHYGFMQDVDVPYALALVDRDDVSFDLMSTSYFLGRETLLPTRRRGMALWRERLFAVMSRNARGATYFFRLPPNRVVELGAQVEL
ncbi:MAG: potassium transporter Kup [Gemmatimonadetes bacterium]|nr:potassium transporter Kup [Gemmatimonadota bacterium]